MDNHTLAKLTLHSIADDMGLKPSEVLSRKRGWRLSLARGLLVQRLRASGWSLEQIGQFMDGRSRVAIWKTERRHAERMAAHKEG